MSSKRTVFYLTIVDEVVELRFLSDTLELKINKHIANRIITFQGKYSSVT